MYKKKRVVINSVPIEVCCCKIDLLSHRCTIIPASPMVVPAPAGSVQLC